jgi:hypothetical protein
LAPVAWLKQRFSGFRYRAFQYREFQYTGSAIKPQESQSPDFSKEVRRNGVTPATHDQLKIGKEVQMLRAVLIAALLCASEAAFSQELTAEQRSACKGDYQKYCKGTTPGGGRIIACLSKSSDKLTAGCRKILTEAEKK